MAEMNPTPVLQSRGVLWQQRQKLTQAQNLDEPIQDTETSNTGLSVSHVPEDVTSKQFPQALPADYNNLQERDKNGQSRNAFLSDNNQSDEFHQNKQNSKTQSHLINDDYKDIVSDDTKYNSFNFGRKIGKLHEKIKFCNLCHGKMEDLPDKYNREGPPLGKVCTNSKCNHFQAVADDTVSIHDVDKALAQLKTNLCSNSNCNNSNMYQYQIRASEEHGYVIYCMQCTTETSISTGTNVCTEVVTSFTRTSETPDKFQYDSDGIHNKDEQDVGSKSSGWYAWYEWFASPVKRYFERDTKKQRDVRYLKNNVTLASSVVFATGLGVTTLPLSLFCTMVTINGIAIYETIQDIKENCKERKAGKISTDDFKEKVGQNLGEGIASVGASTGIAFLCQFGGKTVGTAVAAVGAPYLVLPAANIGGMIGYNLGEAISKYLKQ